ncbi:MAG: hypothetical protein IJ050_10375 [Clostridia bacterium]|nr:hypothetical protein [Clostridia bacterium]
MMNKKVLFFPAAGCLSGVASVASGFILSCGVKDTVSALTKGAVIDRADESFDFYSYFFGGSQAASVDDTALMAAKLVELCGKGFGLLLIMLGLFAVCFFGCKIEKAVKAPAFAPGCMPPEQGFSYGMPDEAPVYDNGAAAAQDYSVPPQDYTVADEGFFNPDVGSGSPESDNIQ